MGRAKEFDEAEVLDRALEMFRARGFKATSFSNLTSGLGVSRQSLYDTYGDKQTLFLTALKRYMDRNADSMRRQLEDTGPVRKVLAGMFEQLITNTCSKGGGCMLVNTMVELAPSPAEARSLAMENARRVEGMFATRLSAAQRKGEISKEKDPNALARFFYHNLMGMAVAARTLDDKDSLRQTASLALQVLD